MDALELRKKIKKKKPEFIRQDAHKRKKVGWKWRKPKGHQSKMRRNLRGYKRKVQVGFGSPNEVKGMHSSGVNTIIVNNIKEMESAEKGIGIIIAANVGERKKIDILKKAKENNVKILNVKDIESYLKESSEKASEKKDKKEKASKKKEEKKKEKEKKARETDKKGEGLAEKLTEEEKKDQEKKEKDKLLTQG